MLEPPPGACFGSEGRPCGSRPTGKEGGAPGTIGKVAKHRRSSRAQSPGWMLRTRGRLLSRNPCGLLYGFQVGDFLTVKSLHQGEHLVRTGCRLPFLRPVLVSTPRAQAPKHQLPQTWNWERTGETRLLVVNRVHCLRGPTHLPERVPTLYHTQYY